MKNPLNLSIAILIFVVLGCSCPAKLAELANTGGSSTPAPSATSTPGKSSTPDLAAVKNGKYDLTMAKYKQLSIGQARSDVERILGGKGTEISSTKGGGVSFSVNKWEGENYKSIILSFKDDKIMSKSQVGLK